MHLMNIKTLKYLDNAFYLWLLPYLVYLFFKTIHS